MGGAEVGRVEDIVDVEFEIAVRLSFVDAVDEIAGHLNFVDAVDENAVQLNFVDAVDEIAVELNLVDAGVDFAGVELGFEAADSFFGSRVAPILSVSHHLQLESHDVGIAWLLSWLL